MSNELADLIALSKNEPDVFRRMMEEDPKFRRRIEELVALDDIWRAGEEVSAGGFAKWYEELYQRKFPKILEQVAEEFAWAYHNRKGVMLEAWRGFGKSTFFTAWSPYVMGVNPIGSTALIRINDAKAKEMGKAISNIIMNGGAWKKMFPHVLPDERAGWSVENGFEVLNTKVTGMPGSSNFETNYSKWRMACLADHLSEKSLLCNGIESGSNIGLHPTNGMWFDDLHDEQNTSSLAEMKKVINIMDGNIKPTWFSAGGSPTLGVFCTPWSKNPPDVYQIMLQTGLFKHVKLPIFKDDPDGEAVPETVEMVDGDTVKQMPVPPEWAGKTVKLAWPDVFPITKVAQMMVTYKTRFGQMCLLDVELSKPKNMKYHDFPHKDIRFDQWTMVLGVDPVGWVKGVSKGDGISHFAAAEILLTPFNNVVVAGGFVEKIDALEGEKRVAEQQRTYAKTYRNASIELNGIGAIWIAMITRTSGIKYHSHQTSEIGPGSKRERQYRFLQPIFASGAALVSDDPDDPFLAAVREYFDVFPNFTDDSYLADVGDALCNGLIDIPEIWTKIVVDTARTDIFNKRGSIGDPYVALLEGRR
jgi:hypothetical protein